MPLFRTEKNWTFSSAITKVLPKHEIRVGFDFVRLELNHYQAEFGPYGLKGGFAFSNNTTGSPGYTSPGWNSFAAFLLGLPNSYSKDFQEIQMTGRENQFALYVRDRWNATSKLTLSLGVRMEYYPLMKRADSGIERLDLNTWTLLMGGRGDVPEDVGIDMKKMYFAPRLGAMYRLSEKNVIRAGYGRTINPLPWSRPMRGAYPYDVYLSQSGETYGWATTLAQGIPGFTMPDLSTGRIPLPFGRERIEGGHAVLALGYDDELSIANAEGGEPARGALLVRNSWGKGWGEKGYGWLPYDYVRKGLAEDFWSVLKKEWIDTGEFKI